MFNNKKEDDIEELSLDVELKIDPQDIKIENLDFDIKDENIDTVSSDDNNKVSSSSNNGASGSDAQDAMESLPDEGVSSGSDAQDAMESLPDEGVSSGSDAQDAMESLPDEGVSSEDDEQKPTSPGEENNTSTDGASGDDSSDKIDEKSTENKENSDQKNESEKNEKDNDNKEKDKKEDNPSNNEEKKDNNPNDKKKDNEKPKNDKEKPDSPVDKKESPNEKASDKKRKGAKNKQDNRPKGKDFGKNLGDKVKNGAKNKAQNALNNSKVGQAINKGKKAAQTAKKAAQAAGKAAQAAGKAAKAAGKAIKAAGKTVGLAIKSALLTNPVGWIILGVIAVILLIIFLVILFSDVSPLVGGEVQDEENYNKYSEVDQKTINKLKEISEKYPTGDPAYAMVATIYPYIEEMQNGNVASLRGKTNEEQEDEEDAVDDTSDDEESTDIKDSEDDTIDDDPYLELLRQKKYYKKFEKLLKKSTKGDNDPLTNYLKDTWFKKDAGYKDLFNDATDEQELSDAIIDDLLSLKDDFIGYFFENCTTTYNFESGGQINPNGEDMKQMMMGNVVIDLLEPGCGNSETCSIHEQISFDKYIKGVIYEEINSFSDLEQIKAQMVAAKSYTLSKRKPSLVDGVYIVKMRWSTADHDYCDYEKGCEDVDAYSSSNNVAECVELNCGHKANHGPASEEVKALYDQAWEETKNTYILDTDGTPRGNYKANCSKGKCMSQDELETMKDIDYKSILQHFYTSYAIAEQEGEYTTTLLATSNQVCGNEANGTGLPDDQFVFQYQTDYKEDLFCGSDATIATAGCGGTSYSMLVANLSDNTSFTPINASDEGYAAKNGSCSGKGSNPAFFTNTLVTNHEGFTAETIPVTKDGISQVLYVIKNGGLVAANVQGNSPFTGGGHWILIRGVTSDGKIKVADPSSEKHSRTETFDLNAFIDENYLIDKDGITHSWIAIYGPKSEQIKTSYGAGDGYATGTLGYPVEGVTGCDDSDYPNYSSGGYHGGTDMNSSVDAKKGMNILAADGGTVKTVKNLSSSYGSHVIIDHGNGYTTLYAHMQKGSITVKEGQLVSKGQLLGKLGDTGKATGPHLHIELRKNDDHNDTKNPCQYIGSNKSYVNE